MNIMKYMNKYFFVIGVVLFFASCVKEETIYFDAENKGWISFGTENETFLLKDNNGISTDFQQFSNESYFLEGSSAFIVFTYRRTFREYTYKKFMSWVYNNNFSISLTAPYEPPGDELSVKLNKTGFAYNLNNKVLTRIEVNPAIYTEGVNEYVSEPEDEIKSKAEIISLTIEDVQYNEVLHFTLNDLQSNWNEFTVTEIYIAKGIGLIKYKLNNGITYERINN